MEREKNVKIDYADWKFLKVYSAQKEIPIKKILKDLIKSLKDKFDK